MRSSITKLAISNDRCNKTRSILVILSIWLTVILLTVVASFGYGIVRMQRENAGIQYGSYYGTFRNVSEKQVETMRMRGEFTMVGVLASVLSTDQGGTLFYADEAALEMTNQKQTLIAGEFPQKEDEIAASTAFFEKYGLKDAKPGATVQIRGRGGLDVPYSEKTYTVSGILKEGNAATGKTAFVSRALWESETAASDRQSTAYFRLDDSTGICAENAEQILYELAETCGIDPKYASDNYAYLSWALDPGTETLVVCTTIILVIILFSVLVIYNIFQVGITQKIQEYGKVRAIGVTRRQMRRLVWQEGMLLALVGIPAGILCGTGIVAVLFPVFVDYGSQVGLEGWKRVSPVSIQVLAVVALISFLAVWAALKRPMRMVASLSPVEAMRYQEIRYDDGKKGMRRGRKELGAAGLTLASLSGQRKRVTVTILTMGLSCVLFVVMANFAGNMEPEYDARKSIEYGDYEISLDCSMNDQAYPENNLDAVLAKNPLDETLIEEIWAIDGVLSVKTRQILFSRQLDEDQTAFGKAESIMIYPQDDFVWEQEQGSTAGTFTYDSVSEMGGIVFGWSHFMEDYEVEPGQTRSMEIFNGKETRKISAQVAGAFGSIDADWAMTEESYEALGLSGSSIGKIWVSCEKEKAGSVGERLQQLLSEKEYVELESYKEALYESERGIFMMRQICYTLSIMVAVISFLNMANTMVTSVIARRQEFGMLQAIGMTKEQLNWCLIGEGAVLSAGTLLVAMGVGIPCGYAVFLYGKTNSWIGLHTYHVPLAQMGAMALFLAVFQLTLSYVITRNLRKESLIERIRYRG